MGKMKKMMTAPRVILLIVFLLMAVWTIQPRPWVEGVTIRHVVANSSASIGGIESPKTTLTPMSRERVEFIEIEQKKHPILTEKDYHDAVALLEQDQKYRVVTNKRTYNLKTVALTETNFTGKLVEIDVPVTREVFDNETNSTVMEYVTEEIVEVVNETAFDEDFNPIIIPKNVTRFVNKTKKELVNETITTIIGVQDIGLVIYQSPTTNLRKGLDLQGGTRVVLEPDEPLSDEDFDSLKSNMERRLNIFGLSDISVRKVYDKPLFLGGKPTYMLIEIPGANEQEVKELIAKQGKFEAKIGNNTVFRGGQDITYVCRSADCSGIDPQRGCSKSGSQWGCSFFFTIAITPEAADKQANLTGDLAIVGEGRQQYLSEPLKLYVDDVEVDELNIAADLRGRPVKDISITGSGLGATQSAAITDSLKNMKALQTILITGSLPVKMNIIKTDNISPTLGESFVKNTLLIGVLAVVAVSLVIFIRYRKFQITMPIILTLVSEVVLLLGFASFIGWNLDIAAIAGVIIAAGTGVDHLIVITDETLRGESRAMHWRQKLKNAFFIITAAYFTTSVAMVPLLFAGAGLLKGFAFTTLVGISFGVLVARPAYAKMIEVLLQ